PNDLVAMLLFNRPQFDNDPPGVGAFNAPQFNLSRNYQGMVDALWTPTNAVGADVRPYSTSSTPRQVPAAFADYTANTTSSFGFMLAPNQFRADPALATPPAGGGPVGGLGRKGAGRVVIYETDGMANEDAVPVNAFVNNGPYNSYYPIRPGDPVNGA